jgi:class 3 adenylate cyclase
VFAESCQQLRLEQHLGRHHHVVRHELARFDGEEIDTAGDGFLALFTGPARAIRCAAAASAGEVLVSATTRDLVAGAGLVFKDRGEIELKGIGVRRLYVATP